MSENNYSHYEKEDVVDKYVDEEDLLPAEKTILALLKPTLPNMKMLDMGVGAGRTTGHFAPLVRDYLGADISSKMIEFCQKKFSTSYPQAKFSTCDATAMTMFSEGEFDFILFSFNGIDHIPAALRKQTLSEIRRVLKGGGIFCFSAHNIQSVETLTKIKFSKSPYWTGKSILKAMITKFSNGNFREMKTRDNAIVKEWLDGHFYDTYYISPEAQVRELASAGFKGTRVFNGEGKEVELASDYSDITDRWAYYLVQG